MRKLKELFFTYKSVIMYLFFGGCTTLVNIVVYYICAHFIHTGTLPGTIIAWIASVLFAYVTNRKWVFESKEKSLSGITKEMLRFFACRLATGVIDWVCMFIFVDMLNWNDMFVKIGVNILVIILNYIASKLIIFRKKNEKEQ